MDQEDASFEGRRLRSGYEVGHMSKESSGQTEDSCGTQIQENHAVRSLVHEECRGKIFGFHAKVLCSPTMGPGI